MKRALGVFVVWLLACAPAAAPAPAAPPRASPAPAPAVHRAAAEPAQDPDYLPEVDRVLGEMARIRQLAATARVAGRVISRDELLQRLREEVLKDLKPELITGTSATLWALNLVPRDFDLVGAMLELYASELAGFYEPHEKRMYLLADLDPVSERATLWHELVHALQDQHYDLSKHLEWAPDENDRLSAVQSLAEGDAMSAMLDAMLAPQGKTALDMAPGFFDQASNGMKSPKLARIPAILKRSVLVPYSDGLTFTNELRRSGGWSAVDGAWKRLPASTEQVLHLEKYLANELPDAIPLPPPPSPSFKLIYRDVLGEQSLRLVFEEWLPRPAAAEAAGPWAGDRQAVYADGDLLAVGLRIRYETDAAAERGARALFQGVVTRPKPDSLAATNAVGPVKHNPKSEFCEPRKLQGPFAVVVREREVAVAAGPFTRNSAGPVPEASCTQALRWARDILRTQ